MSTWSIYELATGRIVNCITGPRLDVVEQNLLPGQACIEGALRADRHLVVLQSDAEGALVPLVVDHMPEQPADDELQTWSWDASQWRWVAAPTLAAIKARRIAQVQAQIEALEAQQLRPQRDVLTAMAAGQPAPIEAVERLQEIEAAIVPLRTTRAAIAAAASQAELDAIP